MKITIEDTKKDACLLLAASKNWDGTLAKIGEGHVKRFITAEAHKLGPDVAYASWHDLLKYLTDQKDKNEILRKECDKILRKSRLNDLEHTMYTTRSHVHQIQILALRGTIGFFERQRDGYHSVK